MKINCLITCLIIIISACNFTNEDKPISDSAVATEKRNVLEVKKEKQSNFAHPTKAYFNKNNFKHPWLENTSVNNLLANRIATPEGYERKKTDDEQTEYLRSLPLKAGQPKVKLFNGQLKGNQSAHFYVIDLDVGKKDLQQCADAVMRLRAEYLLQANKQDRIQFKFTNGDNCKWSLWQQGWRPHVKGNKVEWKKSAQQSSTYANFKKYMEMVYNYAGSLSLSKEMKVVPFKDMQVGDVLIQGGSPGHAVMVVDMAENKNGEKTYLLAQSYMPAQEMHILKNPSNKKLSPWYSLAESDEIATPEWSFNNNDLKRF